MKNLRTICEGGILVAAALVLSYVEIPLGAFGGSLSLAMLPIVVFALRRGTLWGVGAGLIFGIINPLLSGKLSWGIPALLLDYVLAYALVGLAGLVRIGAKMPISRGKAALGAGLGCLLRYLAHVTSGVTIWAITAPTEISNPLFTATFASPWLYSIVYNAVYMIPTSVAVIAVTLLLHKLLTPEK